MQHHRARNRLSREEVKEDDFLTWVYRVVGYVEKNSSRVIAGAGIAVALVLVSYFIKSSSDRRAQAAVVAIGEVQVDLMKGDADGAIQKAQQILTRFSGEPAAARAQLLLGNAFFQMQRIPDARAAFQAFLKEHGEIGPEGYGAWCGLAACLEEEGNLPGAADEFLAYVAKYPKSPFAPLGLKEAARCYGLSGDTDRQIQILERIRKDYPGSPAAREAESALRVLGVESI